MGAAQVWAVLGSAPHEPAQVRLPAAASTKGDGAGDTWTRELRGLRQADPATAVMRAREAFRATVPGRERIDHALAAVADGSFPTTVRVGLATELAAPGKSRNADWHDRK